MKLLDNFYCISILKHFSVILDKLESTKMKGFGWKTPNAFVPFTHFEGGGGYFLLPDHGSIDKKSFCLCCRLQLIID